MEPSDHDSAVQQFRAITSASESTARFYLEQTEWNVEEAIEHYYANDGAEAPAAAVGGPSAPAAGQPSRGGGARRVPSGNIRGFGDIGGQEESEEEEDEDNEYYAGGAKSGVAVRGGPREGGDRDRVADLFDQVRRAGAEEGRGEDLRGPGEGGFCAFTGGARTLQGSGAAAAPATGAGAGAGAGAGPSQGRQPQQVARGVTVKFYRNGVFTVDDGEPRSVSDPANLPFMEAIMRGRCPPELDPGDPSITVEVNLLKETEDYVAPAKPKVVAFAGAGRKLGGDDGASTSGAAAAPPPSTAAPGSVVWEGADESQPTTSIQLRLTDGSRMVAKFNLTHTVADIRRFIHASRPDLPLAYRLATAFPAQQLEDDSITIQAAGLANSVIIQKA